MNKPNHFNTPLPSYLLALSISVLLILFGAGCQNGQAVESAPAPPSVSEEDQLQTAIAIVATAGVTVPAAADEPVGDEILASTDAPLPTATLEPAEPAAEPPAQAEDPTAEPPPIVEPTDVPAPTEEPTEIPAPAEEPTPVPPPTEEPTAVPIPTEEPTAVPAPTTEPTEVPPGPAVFSMASASTNAPSDVLTEINAWVGGGGGQENPGFQMLEVKDGLIMLRGFAPNERIRIFEYLIDADANGEATGRFGRWEGFSVDANGDLTIVLGDSMPVGQTIAETNIVAVGEQSGEILEYFNNLNESILASAPRFTNFQYCLEPCNGANSVTEVPGGTEKVYLYWTYHNIPAGAQFTREWSTGEGVWVRYECTWSGPPSGEVNISLREPGGLYSAYWRVAMTINGEQLLEEFVNITGDWDFWDPAGTIYDCF